MIERLQRLELPMPAGPQHPRGPLRLQRAWPRDDGHLVLEYLDADGRLVPGQWLRDADRREKIARQTARSAPDPGCVLVTDEGVVLQGGGADRRLTALAPLVAGSTLLTHRPERRAVVRVESETGRRFFKIVRPDHVGDLLAIARYLESQPDRPFDIPEIVGCDEANGIVAWSQLPGRCMFDMLDEPEHLVPAAEATGRALRWMHTLDPPSAPIHDAAREMILLEERLERLAVYRPSVHRRLGNLPARVIAGLAFTEGANEPECSLVHRDLYDKQIFATPNGRIGLLDFDTLAIGEPALDIANMLIHFELRAMQGRLTPANAQASAKAFLRGYDPPTELSDRLPAWSNATRLRLACLYAYRPTWPDLPAAILAHLHHNTI